MGLFSWIRRRSHPQPWLERYQGEVGGKIWARALLAWVESSDSVAHPRGPVTFLEALETAAGLYALHTVMVTGRTGPLRTPAVAAFGCHALEVVVSLLRQEGTEPDIDEAATCFFHFMTVGMPPDEAAAFAGDAGMLFERLRDAAQSGDEVIREWRSDLYTAVSGKLLTGIQDVSNLGATNWNALLNDLCARLLDALDDDSHAR